LWLAGVEVFSRGRLPERFHILDYIVETEFFELLSCRYP
jgi:hypothetical protein